MCVCGGINETQNIQFTWTEKDWETRRVWLIETVSRTMIRHSQDPLSVGTTSVIWGMSVRRGFFVNVLDHKTLFDCYSWSICHHEGGVSWTSEQKSWVFVHFHSSSEEHHIFLENYNDDTDQ